VHHRGILGILLFFLPEISLPPPAWSRDGVFPPFSRWCLIKVRVRGGWQQRASARYTVTPLPAHWMGPEFHGCIGGCTLVYSHLFRGVHSLSLVASLNARPCPNPWDSGLIQWARGGVGLCSNCCNSGINEPLHRHKVMSFGYKVKQNLKSRSWTPFRKDIRNLIRLQAWWRTKVTSLLVWWYSYLHVVTYFLSIAGVCCKNPVHKFSPWLSLDQNKMTQKKNTHEWTLSHKQYPACVKYFPQYF